MPWTPDKGKWSAGFALTCPRPTSKPSGKHFPHADIIHDKFHISQHLRGMETLGDEALARQRMLGRCGLGVAKAWYLKELFRHFLSRRRNQIKILYWGRYPFLSQGIEPTK